MKDGTATNPPRPWYREPWPWLLMLGPFLVIVAGAITAVLAIKSNDGLVDDDYYKQGLAINRRVERDEKAIALGVKIDFTLSPDRRQVRALLRTQAGGPFPEALMLFISHPTHAGSDQKVVLKGEGGGIYTGPIARLAPGYWRIGLEDLQGNWRVVGRWRIDSEAMLHWNQADTPMNADN